MEHVTRNTTIYLNNKNTKGNLAFKVDKDAKLILFDLITGKSNIDRDITVSLMGEGAAVEVNGLFFGGKEQHYNIAHTIIHDASHTRSRLLVKGALEDKSNASYQALIRIPKGSVGCAGEQSAHTLLLSETASFHPVPSLEIENNDVKASHSVATTYIDDIKKFYLESRGMSEDEAVRTIVEGHFAELLNKIPDEKMRIEIENKIKSKLC